MCVVSMIYDYYFDKWRWPEPVTVPVPYPVPYPVSPVPVIVTPPPITPAEIEECRKLLERAREYDKAHNEPDCELEEKREKLKKRLGEAPSNQTDRYGYRAVPNVRRPMDLARRRASPVQKLQRKVRSDR